MQGGADHRPGRLSPTRDALTSAGIAIGMDGKGAWRD